jgi:transcriptional regulator GlxA family with amidase domain
MKPSAMKSRRASLIELRLEKARALVASRSMPLIAIAARAGSPVTLTSQRPFDRGSVSRWPWRG